jgi:hypothetical protein
MTTTRRRLHELNHSYLRRVARRIEKQVRRCARQGETRFALANPHREIVSSEMLSILRDKFRDCSVRYETGALIISWE